MILVTVGAAEKGMEFDRLIRKADELAGQMTIPFVMQIGSSSWQVKNAESFRYAPFQKMMEFFKKAELVIAHCGSGVVLNAVNCGVPIVAVPRLVALREHDLDDHQLHLADRLEGKKGIYIVRDIENLAAVVREALEKRMKPSVSEFEETRKPLLRAIENSLKAVS